jgi:hypothetical protein
MSAISRLSALRQSLRERTSTAVVFLHPADGPAGPSVGISGDPDDIRELESLSLQIEPCLVELGADIPTEGKTADGRVLFWAMQILQNKRGVNFTELADEPFGAIALAINLFLADRVEKQDPTDAMAELARGPEAGNSQASADWEPVVAALGDESTFAIIKIAQDKAKSADERMRNIWVIDNRVLAWNSPKWAKVLGVTDAAVRKTDWWKVDRSRLRE